MRFILPVLIAALVAGVVNAAVRRARRRCGVTPEINQHPERLDQMLDPTDDA